ncbi:hypothetical protein HDV57DRAFT_103083 [Trichoderma longibrachiatum]
MPRHFFSCRSQLLLVTQATGAMFTTDAERYLRLLLPRSNRFHVLVEERFGLKKWKIAIESSSQVLSYSAIAMESTEANVFVLYKLALFRHDRWASSWLTSTCCQYIYIFYNTVFGSKQPGTEPMTSRLVVGEH